MEDNMEKYIKNICSDLSINANQVHAVLNLLSEDCTVPFISRYRKEVTGGLDEVQIITIRDRMEQAAAIEKRREFILKSIDKQEKLTPELKKQIDSIETLTELEDIYLPYKPKRKTRATSAREKGLEPLANKIFESTEIDPLKEAEKYISDEKGVSSVEDALSGARDIIAEKISEDSDTRKMLRTYFEKESALSAKVVKAKKDQAQKYKDYFEWSEPAEKAPSHRILAVLRGMDEGFLAVHFLPEEEPALKKLEKKYIKSKSKSAEQLQLAVKDSYKRLLSPSLENEIKSKCRERAEEEAIRVFAKNAGELLMSPPLGGKSVLAVDPGQRTGCKVVCLNRYGDLLEHTAIFPLEPHNKKNESESIIIELIDKYNIEAVAVGNGTGGKETVSFLKSFKKTLQIPVITVNESGASIYSASETARKEFPDKDVTVRGAVSIGRRLMDPLAELVKIDPKSIGVGQYQHDVDQKKLKKSLDDTVLSCVNSVGVEVNTSSADVLKYVSGLSPKIAESIVSYRSEHGAFKDRKKLKLVKGMGNKSYEQAAGFLRIHGGANPLDASAVHPESYDIVKKMAEDLNCSIADLVGNEKLVSQIKLENYVTDSVGKLTLNDILDELKKPGRDPRSSFEYAEFKEDINSINDLEKDMVLEGVVTNVTAFGAFVDIGVHQDGLVHISELADSFVKDPADVVKLNQVVTVRVLSIDEKRNRISLSMKSGN